MTAPRNIVRNAQAPHAIAGRALLAGLTAAKLAQLVANGLTDQQIANVHAGLGRDQVAKLRWRWGIASGAAPTTLEAAQANGRGGGRSVHAPNGGTADVAWTPAMIAKLLEMRRDWRTAPAIAQALGIAPGNVIGKIRSLAAQQARVKRYEGTTERPCLNCHRPFQSEGPHNRLCKPCGGVGPS